MTTSHLPQREGGYYPNPPWLRHWEVPTTKPFGKKYTNRRVA